MKSSRWEQSACGPGDGLLLSLGVHHCAGRGDSEQQLIQEVGPVGGTVTVPAAFSWAEQLRIFKSGRSFVTVG